MAEPSCCCTQLNNACLSARQALSPFLKHKVLRRIIQTFGNGDGTGLQQTEDEARASLEVREFESWALNPRVQELLSNALALIESGSVSEKQLEHHLVSQLKASPSSEARAEFDAASRCTVVLGPDQLVSALNEHVS